MTNSRLKQLRALADSLREKIGDTKSLPGKLREKIGESFIRDLEKLTDTEAVQCLKSVDDSKVVETYLILSKRLSSDALAEICLEYMKRSKPNTRLTGAGGIGICLKRTNNKEASNALAQMIRNPEESDDIKLAAYSSLELINYNRPLESTSTIDVDELFQLLENDIPSPSDAIRTIDWSFVDSFL
jgi:hypothetical protein